MESSPLSPIVRKKVDISQEHLSSHESSDIAKEKGEAADMEHIHQMAILYTNR